MKKPSSSMKDLLATLDVFQREAVLKILKRLQDGTKLLPEDVGLLGIDLSAVSITFAASFFHVTRKAVYDWNDLGCPHTKDGTYSLYEMYEWRLARATEKATGKGGGLKDQKLQKEIDYLQAKLENVRSENIPRKEHEEVLRSLVIAVRGFIEQWFRKNAHVFVQQPKEVVDVICDEAPRAILNKLGGKGEG
jgi:hypothetical protein